MRRWTIGNDDKEIILKIINQYDIKTVLEFGPGESTKFFAENNIIIDSIEKNKKLYKNTMKLLSGIKGVRIFNYVFLFELKQQLLDQYDLAFVDGPHGITYLSRIEQVLFAKSKTKLILLHDTNRHGEQETLNFFMKAGAKITNFSTKMGLSLISLF